MLHSPARKHQVCALGLSPGLVQPSYFRSPPVVLHPGEVTQSDRPCYELSQGSHYILRCLRSFPFPSFGENIKLCVSFTCAYKPDESMDGRFSISATWGDAPKDHLPLGYSSRDGMWWGGGWLLPQSTNGP